MKLRCNGKNNCEDSSDEEGCKLIILNVGYNKLIVPIPENTDKLNVTVSYEAKEVLLIDESTKGFRLLHTFTKTWNDNFLTFANLQHDSENFVSEADYQKIWIPWIFTLNIESEDKVKKTDKKEIVKILPNTKFEYYLNSLKYQENAHLFNGSTNMMYCEKDWTYEYICSFDYRWYPFDTQNCPIEMSSSKRIEVMLLIRL